MARGRNDHSRPDGGVPQPLSASPLRRLQLVLGALLAVGIAAGAVVAVLAGSGSDGRGAATVPGQGLPAPRIEELGAAVEASGCSLRHAAAEGRGHEDREFTPADYRTNPPTSGPHTPAVAQDRIYAPGATPPLGQLVHSLEHGRINLQYAPGTDPALVRRLEAFVAENGGYHMLLYENATGMDAQVAATAWTQMLTCPEAGPRMWDALRAFRDAYLDKGPELIP